MTFRSLPAKQFSSGGGGSTCWDLVSLELLSPSSISTPHVNSILPRLIQVRAGAANAPATIQHLLSLESQSLVAPEAALVHGNSSAALLTRSQSVSPPSSLASSYSESSECTLPESPQKFFAELTRFCACLNNQSAARFVDYVQPDTRESVVSWISKVIVAMRWPLGAFFTAVHAFDFSLTDQSTSHRNGGLTTTHPVQNCCEGCIPLLSTACVLVGVSSECDHKQLAKARCFVGQVPNVSSVRDIICKQLAIVAFLNRGTLVNKTPLDFTILFLASLKLHAPDTYELLMENGVLGGEEEYEKDFSSSSLLRYVCQIGDDEEGLNSNKRPWSIGCLLVELCLGVSVVAAVTQAYCGYPVSRIIAAIIIDVVTRVDTSRRESLSWFCATVFRMDYRWEIVPVLQKLPGIYRTCRHFDSKVTTHDGSTTLLAWPAKANLLLDLLLS